MMKGALPYFLISILLSYFLFDSLFIFLLAVIPIALVLAIIVDSYNFLKRIFSNNQSSNDAIVEGLNNFIYINGEGEVELKKVDVNELDEDRFHGIDTQIHERRTYLYDRVLRIYSTKEIKEIKYEDISNEIEILQEAHQSKIKKKRGSYETNPEGKCEVCFTGFKAQEKAEMINIAKENHMIVRSSVTANLDMLVMGDNAGERKIKTAQGKGIKICDKEGFLDFLETGEM